MVWISPSTTSTSSPSRHHMAHTLPQLRHTPVGQRVWWSVRQSGLPGLLVFVLLGAWCGLQLQRQLRAPLLPHSSSSTSPSSSSSSQLRLRLHHDGQAQEGAHDDASTSHDEGTCRYYLAESAIAGGGLGLFSVVGIPTGQRVGLAGALGDLCLHVDRPPPRTMLDTHTWSGSYFYGQFEGAHVRSACEGFATFVNTMPPSAVNTVLRPMTTTHPVGLFRQTQPGAGAITLYDGVTATAIDHIRAGEEITIDYGDWEWDQKKMKKYQRPSRNPDDIRRHGWCVDNIIIRVASDPAMGRGAFATRALPKGQVVAPAPLQLFANRTAFSVKRKAPEALFVNYCYQPKGTNLLLYPYGPGVGAINHHHLSPNVALRWADPVTNPLHHANLLTLPARQFWRQAKPGNLVLEIVALRDIAPNEELFLDYGREWDQAWRDHVRAWRPPTDAKSLAYVYPSEMDETLPVRTMTEQKTQPYAPNLATACATPDWKRQKANKVVWREPNWPIPMSLVYCHILDRYTEKGVEHGDEIYNVALSFDVDDAEFDPSIPKSEQYLDIRVPRRAIRFVNKPYQSDQYLASAFRHPLGFPDELIPDTWKSGSF